MVDLSFPKTLFPQNQGQTLEYDRLAQVSQIFIIALQKLNATTTKHITESALRSEETDN